ILPIRMATYGRWPTIPSSHATRQDACPCRTTWDRRRAPPDGARKLFRRPDRLDSAREHLDRHGRGERKHQPPELLRDEVSARQGLSRGPRERWLGRPADPRADGLREPRRRAASDPDRRHFPQFGG